MIDGTKCRVTHITLASCRKQHELLDLFRTFAPVLKKLALSISFMAFSLFGYAQTSDSVALAMLDSLYDKQLNELDSVQQQTKMEYANLKHEYDSVEQDLGNSIAELQSKRDSLEKLNLPTTACTKKLDSLTQLKEARLAAVKSKTDALKERSANKINSLKLPPEISKEAQHFTQKFSILDVTMPGSDVNLPTISSLGSMSNISKPGVDIPGMPYLPTQGTNTLLPQGVGEIKTPEIGGEIMQPGDQVKEVTEKLKDPTVKEEARAKAEEKIVESKPVKNVTEKMGLPKIDVPLADGQITKDELQEQAKKQTIDHFAGKEKQVQEAMSQMLNLKQKYNSVQSINDLPKKSPNPMKIKPFVERLLPGLLFQVHRQNDWMIDVNPYAGYRVNGKLTLGAGWNHRFTFIADQHEMTQSGVYGPRFYGEYDLFKGLQPRMEFELMRTQVPSFNPSGEPTNRQWVRTMFLGLNKKYKISKHVKGTTSVMYNLFDVNHKSPYGDKVVVRFGFELALKKKKKV